MSRLVLCSVCSRHVRDDEVACPFCGALPGPHTVGAGPPGEPAAPRVTSVSARAAILFFGAVATGACGDGQPGDGSSSNVVMPYGAPPRPDPTPSPTPPPPPSTEPQPVVAQPYGAPPIPTPSAPPAPSSSSAPATVPPYGVPPVPPPPPPPTPQPSKK